jgi:hypothetical protein
MKAVASRGRQSGYLSSLHVLYNTSMVRCDKAVTPLGQHGRTPTDHCSDTNST